MIATRREQLAALPTAALVDLAQEALLEGYCVELQITLELLAGRDDHTTTLAAPEGWVLPAFLQDRLDAANQQASDNLVDRWHW